MTNNTINAALPGPIRDYANIVNTKDDNYAFVDRKVKSTDTVLVEIVIDGVVYTTKVDNQTWNFDPMQAVWNGKPWPEGEHTIQLRSMDKATNWSDPQVYIINIDKTPPSAPDIWRVVDSTGSDMGNLTPGDSSDERKPVISGVAEPESIVYLYDNNSTTPSGSARADKMGAWTITPDLADGNHELTVTSVDAAGNTSVKSTSFNMTINGGSVVFAEKGAAEYSETASEPAGFETSADRSDPPAAKGRTYMNKGILAPKGDAPEGFVVQVAINDHVYSMTVDSTGHWEFNNIPELPDGSYVYQIRYRDLAQNWGAATHRYLIIDSTAPEKPQIMRAVDNEGTLDWLSPNQYTNDKTPTLSGVAQPGSLVFIYDDIANSQQPIGSVIAGNDGSWTFTTPELSNEGTHSFTASYQDRHGKTSPKSDSFVINLDTSVPAIPKLAEVYDDEGRNTGAIESGVPTDDTTPTLSGTGDSGTKIRIWDGEKIIGTTYVNSQGKWEIELTLEPGKYNLRVDAESKGGNVSPGKSDNFELIIDTSILPPVEIEDVFANNVPGVERSLVSGDSTNDTTPVLRGTGNNDDIIHIFVDGKEVGSTTVVGGTWQYEIPTDKALKEGPVELKVQVEDPVNNKRSGDSNPVNLVIDTTPPTKPSEPTIIDNEGDKTGPVVPGEPIDDKTPEFKGEGGEKGGTVEVVIVDDKGAETVIGTAIVGDNGEWTIPTTTPIPDGEYDVIVKITDPAGNTSTPSDPVSLIVDTKVPGPVSDLELLDDVGPYTGLIKTGDVTDDTKPVLSGKGEDGSKIIIYDGETEIGTVVVKDGKWAFELPELPEGLHDIKVQPISASGVRGEKSSGIQFEVDTTPPTTGTFDSVMTDETGEEKPAAAEENDPTLIMHGTGTNGNLVLLYGDLAHTNLLGSATVVNGQWTINTDKLPDQIYHFNAVFRDAAGNEYSPPTEFIINIDTVGPEAPEFEIGGSLDLMSMSLNDIMAHSNDSLFIDNGKTQMLISEKAGQDLTLEDILPKGEDVNNWSQANGTVTVAGVEYNVYQNNGGEAEVLVPQHLMQEQH